MKRSWAIWAIIWSLSLVCISFKGGILPYSFFAVTTAIPLISLFYILYVYMFFRIFQKVGAHTIVANQPIPFYFRLVNEYWLIFVGVRVRFHHLFSTIQGLSDEIEYELLPQTDIKKETSIVCKYRGEYEIGIKTVEIQDYFRLFHVTYKNKEPLRVVVKPELIKLDKLGNLEINSTIYEAKDNPSDLDAFSRKYVIGDDARFIHWPTTSKTGEIMVRERIGQQQPSVNIMLDLTKPDQSADNYIPLESKLLETTLAVTYYLVEKGIPVTTYTQDDCIFVGRMDAFEEYYNKISDVRFNESKGFEKLFMQHGSERNMNESLANYMMVASLEDDIVKAVYQFNERRVKTVVCVVSQSYIDHRGIGDLSYVEVVQITPDEDLREVFK